MTKQSKNLKEGGVPGKKIRLTKKEVEENAAKNCARLLKDHAVPRNVCQLLYDEHVWWAHFYCEKITGRGLSKNRQYRTVIFTPAPPTKPVEAVGESSGENRVTKEQLLQLLYSQVKLMQKVDYNKHADEILKLFYS